MSINYKKYFDNLTLTLLTEKERQLLHKSLKRFLKNKQVSIFALNVREICNTPEKARLLKYLREYIPRADKNHFDKLTKIQGQEYITGMTTNSRPNFFGRVTIPPVNNLSPVTERLVTIYGSRGDSMGFSIRGGSEYGLGIYVSNVKPGTPAAEACLRSGDQIIKANGVDFHCVANSSAVKVLSSSALLNLVVIRCGKIPEWKIARERVLWYDVSLCRITSSPPVSEIQAPGAAHSEIVNRKVFITISKESDFIGLNIRGGREYGIGIYVSRVDAGGLASEVGLAAGDQIVRVNETDCLSVTHSDAVDALRSSKHLIITIRSVGKYPVFKELYAEYTWSEASSLSTTTSSVIVRSRLVTAPGDSSSGKYSHRTRTRESSIDLPSLSLTRDNVFNNSDLEDTIDELNDSLEIESQVCYPGDKDIMFRKNNEDSWQEIDALSDNYAYTHNTTKSWSVGKTDSIGHYRQDSDLSDHVLDYTTFLEQTSLKDQQERKTKYQQVETSSLLRDENIVIETVIEEKVTSFAANPKESVPSRSDMFISESNDQVYSQVQDLTGKTRPAHARSNTSSSPQYSPIYATVNKTSNKNSNEKTHVYDVVGNGIYSSSNAKDNDGDSETSLKEVIESQIEKLEARKSNLGTWEITRMTEGSIYSKSSSSSSLDSQDKNKTGTWTSLKNKIKGSIRNIGSGQKKRASMPPAEAYSGNSSVTTTGSLEQKGLFERSFGSQILNTQNSERYNLMGMLEDHARVLLTEDEYKAVMRHIHNYHENKQLERLVELLLAILDKQEQKILLVDVRNVIAPSHIALFDSLVAHCNIKGYDEWLNKFNSTENKIQTQSAKSNNYVNSNEKSKSYNVNNHQKNSTDTILAFSKKDFENLPGSLEVVIVETDDTENRKSPIVDDGEEIVYISKHKTILGLEICGGRNNPDDQSIRVKQVITGSAATDDKRLQPGVQITKVDGNSLQGLSCEEAMSMLQIAFSKKIPVNLGIQIRRA